MEDTPDILEYYVEWHGQTLPRTSPASLTQLGAYSPLLRHFHYQVWDFLAAVSHLSQVFRASHAKHRVCFP